MCVFGAYFVCVSRVVGGELALWELLEHISSLFHVGQIER